MAYIGVSPSNGVRKKHTYTATASQTSFSGAGDEGITLAYRDSNYVDVYQNGVKLADEDYTATSGTAIVLAQGASADDIVEIIAFDVFSVADTVSKADGGTFDNAVTITTTDNTTQLTLTSTDADAAVGPVLGFNRNSASAADNDLLGRINFIGKNDADEDVDYGIIRYKITDASNGTEDSDIAIRSMVAGTSTNRISVTSAETVINEDGVDLDFRVESDTITHALFVDGALGNVGVGVVPEAWDSVFSALQVGGTGALRSDASADASDTVGVSQNAYYDSANSRWEYLVTDEASDYYQQSGSHYWRVAASGSADAAITWNTVMSIDSLGLTNLIDHTASSNNEALVVQSKCTSRAGLHVAQQNASFGNTTYGALRIDTVRAQTSAFNFAVFRSNDGVDTEFKIRGDGNAYADNAWQGGGADYAEYFEWSDGNTDSEDRRGYTVVLDGNQIRKSTSDDAQSTIIGVVSANPAMVGDTAQLKWDGKYEKDEWGTYILEEYTQTEWTEDDGEGNKEFQTYQTDKIPSDVTVPDDAVVTSTEEDGSTKLMRRKESSSYNSSNTYVSREDRVEWDTIGLVGKLRIRVGQTVGDRWIKMREISDTVHEYLVR